MILDLFSVEVWIVCEPSFSPPA